MIIPKLIQGFFAVCFFVAMSQMTNATTREDVRQKGFIHCGVHSSLPGFSIQSDQGWQGMEVDLCRAVAAAVLNDAQKVRFKAIASEQGYSALQSGDIDLLIRHNQWSMLPDTVLGLTFVTPWFFQESGFLRRQMTDSDQSSEHKRETVCFYPDAEKHLGALTNHLERVAFPSFGIATKAFENSQCDALPGELTQLAFAQKKLPATLNTQIRANDISPVAIGPLIRQGDLEWFKIVRWTIYWLLNAEKLELTQASVRQLKDTEPASQAIKAASINGTTIGLDANWPIQVIRQIGHYGELFNRHFGDLQLPRGVNNLNHKGGLHFVPPIE